MLGINNICVNAAGDALKKMEDQKGVIARLVIGRRYNALFHLIISESSCYFHDIIFPL